MTANDVGRSEPTSDKEAKSFFDQPDPWRIAGWILCGLIILLYCSSISPIWWRQNDGALYMMLAENLAEGKGYTLWGEPHIHVPPGYPMFVAQQLTAGMGDMLVLNAVNVGLALVTLTLVFLTIRELAGSRIALVTVAALAVTEQMLFYSVVLRSDLPFMFCVWLGMFALVRGLRRGGMWMELGVVGLVACCWTRVVGIPLCLAASVGMVLERAQGARWRPWIPAAILMLGTLATGATFYTYQQHQLAASEAKLPSYDVQMSSLSSRAWWEWGYRPLENFYLSAPAVAKYLTGEMCDDLGPFSLLFWFPIVWGGVLAYREGHRLPLCVMLGYVGGILLQRPMLPRYMLPMAPLLIWFFLLAVIDGAQRLRKRIAKSESRDNLWLLEFLQSPLRAAIAGAVVIAAFNVPKSIDIPVALHLKDWIDNEGEGHYVARAAHFLGLHARSDERYISSWHERKLSYMSGVYPVKLPNGLQRRPPFEPKVLEEWIAEGCTYAVICPQTRPHFSRVLAAKNLEKHGFQLVYERDDVRIFSRRELIGVPRLARYELVHGVVRNMNGVQSPWYHRHPFADDMPPLGKSDFAIVRATADETHASEESPQALADHEIAKAAPQAPDAATMELFQPEDLFFAARKAVPLDIPQVDLSPVKRAEPEQGRVRVSRALHRRSSITRQQPILISTPPDPTATPPR